MASLGIYSHSLGPVDDGVVFSFRRNRSPVGHHRKMWDTPKSPPQQIVLLPVGPRSTNARISLGTAGSLGDIAGMVMPRFEQKDTAWLFGKRSVTLPFNSLLF